MNGLNTSALFGRMNALADSTRSRILLALERNELTVNELRAIMQLPQSTLSNHLKVLSNGGWVTSRSEGTSRLYRLATDSIDVQARKLWNLVRDQIATSTSAEQDSRRAKAVLAQRTSKSQQFFSSSAGEWDRLRADLFGKHTDAALLALFEPTWTVADLGCGTGQVSALISPFVRHVIAVDESSAMLSAAKKRLAGYKNVDVRSGKLESLPLGDDEANVSLLFLVLHYVTNPAEAIAEAARITAPRGKLLVVDMMPHERADLRHAMGHLWQGFTDEAVINWMRDAGLEDICYTPLPPDPDAKGPTLFAATGSKPAVIALKSTARRKLGVVA
jgi:ubiquinone/menaquinone biosynthesis C-methylase UbiE